MKTLTSKIIITFLFIVVNSNMIFSQSNKDQVDHTDFSLTKSIALSGQSDQIEVIVPIIDRKISLTIKISSMVVGGELTIEVYDPTGEKFGNYSIGGQNSIKANYGKSDLVKGESVLGQITKTVEFPITGNWKVLIIPKNAKGSLDITATQTSVKQKK
jgi:hypothetical protein